MGLLRSDSTFASSLRQGPYQTAGRLHLPANSRGAAAGRSIVGASAIGKRQHVIWHENGQRRRSAPLKSRVRFMWTLRQLEEVQNNMKKKTCMTISVLLVLV